MDYVLKGVLTDDEFDGRRLHSDNVIIIEGAASFKSFHYRTLLRKSLK